MRTNELIGPPAADSLEAAAGWRQGASPQGSPAKDLREKVADEREKPKKKVGGFGGVEEIPDAPPRQRASIKETQADSQHDLEAIQSHVDKDAQEPPELNLNPKQNKMRTDLEMFVMDEIPGVFGVDDSEELEEDLQEDGQALKITVLIGTKSEDERRKDLENWLKGGARAELGDNEAKDGFMTEVLAKVQAIQDAGKKKKKAK